MDFIDYKISARNLIGDAYDGIGTYATTLEDLSGLVLEPLAQLIELTGKTDFSGSSFDGILIGELVEAAYAGAEKYAEELYDTTDCTEPLDRIHDYLGLGEL